MFKKLVLILAVAALVAFAGTVPTGSHYKITLIQPAAVQGTTLKAGDYRINLMDSKVTIIADNGKTMAEATVKVETQETKFDNTTVRLDTASGKAVIAEIRIGGTKTRLVFN